MDIPHSCQEDQTQWDKDADFRKQQAISAHLESKYGINAPPDQLDACVAWVLPPTLDRDIPDLVAKLGVTVTSRGNQLRMSMERSNTGVQVLKGLKAAQVVLFIVLAVIVCMFVAGV